MLANLLSLLLAFLGGFFRRKNIEEKAIETVIKEREAALDNVRKANDARARVERDDAYSHVLYEHFRRKDSD